MFIKPSDNHILNGSFGWETFKNIIIKNSWLYLRRNKFHCRPNVMWGKHISLFIYNVIMIFFVKVLSGQILDSHREMFLNEPSQQNVGKTTTKEFFTVLYFTLLWLLYCFIDCFRNKKLFFLYVSKNILK